MQRGHWENEIRIVSDGGDGGPVTETVPVFIPDPEVVEPQEVPVCTICGTQTTAGRFVPVITGGDSNSAEATNELHGHEYHCFTCDDPAREPMVITIPEANG